MKTKLSNIIISVIKEHLNNRFWEWFGNSKVVDKFGSPKIVYSGTDIKNMTENYPIYFASHREIASHFGKPKGYYLKIENPFIMEFSNSWQDIDISELKKKLGDEKLYKLIQTQIGDEWESLEGYLNDEPVWHDPISIEAVVNYIRLYENYDGLIFYNIDETVHYINTDTYVVFDKNQVRSTDEVHL